MAANLLAVVCVLAVWALAGYCVWRWGPGLRKRSVWCPVLKSRAKILAEQEEKGFRNSYAGLSIVDVQQCTLFRAGPVLCHKECLRRFA